MTPAEALTVPVDVGTPRVEVQRIANGTRTWRVVVVAADSTEAALRAAKDLAIKIDGELTVQYDRDPKA